MQEGQIIRRGNSWALRYWIKTKVNDETKWDRKYKTICAVDDQYRSKSQVRHHPDVAGLLDSVSGSVVTDVLTFKNYVEKAYLPDIEIKKTPSTYKGYRNLYNGMIAPLLNGTPLTDFAEPFVSQNLLDKLAARGTLSTRTLIHAKAFISGVLSHAIRNQKMPGVRYNPLHHKLVVVEGGADSEDTYAYNLAEVENILDAVKNNQMYRALIAVAAYAGLRRSEIRGLQWGDIRVDTKTGRGTLSIGRTFWENTEGDTKTEDSKAMIPLIPHLAEELEAYRKQRGVLGALDSYIFEGPRPNVPYDISAIGNKMVKPILAEKKLKDDEGNELWHGWHAFRRGLGNSLHSLGVDMTIIANILRHKGPVTNQIVTEKHYAKTVKMPLMIEAMQRFSDEIAKVRHARR
jgi:integrase